jgi:metal-responsive CopG/Arc/MetJ family transcriptional regulator
MARSTKVVGFSISPALAREYEQITAREKTSKSELFRRMVESYKAKLEEEEFFQLQRKMARRARKKGVFTEREVERIVFEDR